MHGPEHSCENWVAHSSEQTGTISILIDATPAERLDKQYLEEALEKHFLSRLIASAFFRDEVNHAAEPPCPSFGGRNVDDRRQERQE